MESIASELMRNYVDTQKFSSTGEIMEAMKDLFRDALQQVMEGELDETLGCEKSERLSEPGENTLSKNYRNGYSKKIVEHWTVSCRNWDMVLNQLNIMFAPRGEPEPQTRTKTILIHR